MFFVLSKLLIFLLQPLLWLVLLLVWARLARSERRRARLLSIAVLLALVATQPMLLTLAYRWWEVPPVAVASLDRNGAGDAYEVAIVLGGFSRPSSELTDRLDFLDSANRLTQALELYHQGRVRKIMVSGGSAAIIGEKLSEGEAVARFLQRIGFPPQDLIVEGNSRNTHENAVFSATVLTELGLEGERCLLLTDGFHMRRARACFEKAGLAVDPFSTSGSTHPFASASPENLILPTADGFEGWGRLLKELVGMAAYSASGKL